MINLLESVNRKRNQGNTAFRLYDNERSVKDLIDSDQFREDDKNGIDVPFFNLKSILVATDYFSDTKKLGQGGFGPVYKVLTFLVLDQYSILFTSF